MSLLPRKISFCLLVILTISACYCYDMVASSNSIHANKYDYLHIDKIISNERILKRLMDCIMDRGPCTREGRVLKRVITEAFRTDCLNCHERQKVNTGRYLAYLLQYRPEYWNELVEKFDPDGTQRKKFGIDIDSFDEDEYNNKNSDKRQVRNNNDNNHKRRGGPSPISDNKLKYNGSNLNGRNKPDLVSKWIFRIQKIKNLHGDQVKHEPFGHLEYNTPQPQREQQQYGAKQSINEENGILKWPIRNIRWDVSRFK